MKLSFPNPLSNILIAAVLFLAAFLTTRAFLAGSSTSNAASEEVAPDLADPGPGNQSMLPSAGNRGKSLIGSHRSPREFFDLWKAASEMQDDDAISAILQEWALSAPGAGIELALEEDQSDLAWQLVIRWAGTDDQAAIAAGKTIPVRSTNDAGNWSGLWNAVAGKRLREAPEEIAALLSEFPLGLGSMGRITEEQLGNLDPARQAAALEQVSEQWVKARIAHPVLTKWARTDPEAAFQWFEKNLADPEGWALAAVLRGWAAKDPEAAAQQIPGPGNSLMRTRAIREFLAGASENDMEFALEWATKNFDESVKKVVSQQLPQLEGTMALQKLRLELTERGVIEDARNSFAMAAKMDWPPKTEAGVRNWAQSSFYAGVTASPRSWKVDEVQAATAFLIENPDLAKSAGWHRDLSERWAKENPIAALEWSASLPPELQIEAAETAIETWFLLEPKRAIAYTESLPESEFRGYAIEKVIGEWVQSDPDASVQWAASLPIAAERDTAAGRIARHFRFRDPSRAVEIAGSIENGPLRLDSLISIVDVWSRRDRSAAEAFLRQGDFSDSERKALLERLSRL